MTTEKLRAYRDNVLCKIILLDRLLSDEIEQITDLKIEVLHHEASVSVVGYADMLNEYNDNLLGAPNCKRVADYYYTELCPLLRGYSTDDIDTMADRVRAMHPERAEELVGDIKKIVSAVIQNTIALGRDMDGLTERFYVPNSKPQQPEAGKLPISPTDEQIKAFKDYFKAPFLGMGNNQDKFTDYVLPALKRQNTLKDMAAFALALYGSRELVSSRRPKSFAKWLGVVSCIFNIPQMIEYKPNKLPNPDYDVTYHYLTARADKWQSKAVGGQ